MKKKQKKKEIPRRGSSIAQSGNGRDSAKKRRQS